MAVTVIDNNPEFLFARNAQDIVIRGITDDVTVQVDGHSFVLSPFDEEIIVPFREIAAGHAFNDILVSQDEIIFPVSQDILTIAITKGLQSVHSRVFHVVDGALRGGDVVLIGSQFWTWAPQIQKIYPWTRVVLNFIEGEDDSYEEGETYDIELKVWFRDSGLKSGSFDGDEIQTFHVSRCMFTVQDIRAHVDSENEIPDDDEILAFDVRLVRYDTDGAPSMISYPMRFELAPSRVNFREFLFCNSLGMLDFVHNRGDMSEIPEYEYASFKKGGEDHSVSAGIVKEFNVNSGLFTSELDRKQWLEFLDSKIHWIVEQDGSIHEIVVDEADVDAAIGKNGSLNFSFHYSLPPEGRFVARHELNNYIIP